MERVTLSIDGMSCGHCVGQVKSALLGVAGVTVENVSVGSAEVAYDAAQVGPDAIAKAISEAGYDAKIASTKRSALSCAPTPRQGGGGCCR